MQSEYICRLGDITEFLTDYHANGSWVSYRISHDCYQPQLS
jgi:hypothetical protein